jgi:hypothetical protein
MFKGECGAQVLMRHAQEALARVHPAKPQVCQMALEVDLCELIAGR